MAFNPAAFERYRRSPNEKTTLPRLILGSVVAAVFWFATTMAVIFAGTYGWMATGSSRNAFGLGDTIQQFLSTAGGLFATLATFAGIWLGIWVAMRWLHREKLSRLFGNSARLSRSGFVNGLAAVLVTSCLPSFATGSSSPKSGAARSSSAHGRSCSCRSSSSPSSRLLPRSSSSAAICSAALPTVSAAHSPGRCCRRSSSQRCTGTRHPCSA